MSRFMKIIVAACLVAPLAAFAAEEKPLAIGPVNVSGMLDAYFTLNLDQDQTYVNPVRSYDGSPGFHFNMAEVSFSMEAKPAGFRLDLVYGPEGEAAGNFLVLQGYASFKLGPTTVDFGRFVTPAGFELYESTGNWLYTRGLVYTWALPATHTGVRVGYAVNDQLTVTGYFTNGSDLQTSDDFEESPYKTGIVSAVWANDDTSVAVNAFYTKPPGTVDESGFLLDVVASRSFGALSVSVSGDYGSMFDASWTALGANVKYDLNDKLSVAGRFEYFDDQDGLRTGTGPDGLALWDLTAGATYQVGKHAALKAELRYDKADADIFGPPTDPNDSAITAHLAALASF
ncbi:MAG TPA: outer membrane beta-barrel protein [Anaeromyxobacteraceae bacterium]|nr:outer membrane beta-barrel protein [Anaeromyxobacteraceae bacterium]